MTLLLVAVLKVSPEDTVAVVRVDCIDHGECKVEVFKRRNGHVELLKTGATGTNRLSRKTEVIGYDLTKQGATDGLKGEVTPNT